MRSRRVSLSTYRFQSFASPPNRSRCNPQQSSFFRKPRIQLQLMLSSYFTSIAAGTCVASPSQPPPLDFFLSLRFPIKHESQIHHFSLALSRWWPKPTETTEKQLRFGWQSACPPSQSTMAARGLDYASFRWAIQFRSCLNPAQMIK